MSAHKALITDLKWLRQFVEYARYELQPGERQLGDQFPRQGCADEAISKINRVIEGIQDIGCPLCSCPDGLVQEWVSKAMAVAKSKGMLSDNGK